MQMKRYRLPISFNFSLATLRSLPGRLRLSRPMTVRPLEATLQLGGNRLADEAADAGDQNLYGISPSREDATPNTISSMLDGSDRVSLQSGKPTASMY